MANLAGVGLQNVIVTGSFSGLEGSAGAGQCSTDKTDADAFLNTIKIIDNDDINISSMQLTIMTPAGKRGMASLALFEDDKKPPVLCGAPPA